MAWLNRHLALVFVVVGFALFLFGPQYAIHQIPADQRAKMGDFDWVGVEWIAAGQDLMLVGFAIWIVRRLKRRRADA